MSLFINKNIEIDTRRDFGIIFDDEVFAYEKIDRKSIEGIILPEHLSNKKIINILRRIYEK